mmetsp:Transcript_11905/g.18264  ORF Transcript_11905/g.18264 Transcript_11905/m.18264 type:complete len:284 (+) Transcript_11905:32-883(+)
MLISILSCLLMISCHAFQKPQQSIIFPKNNNLIPEYVTGALCGAAVMLLTPTPAFSFSDTVDKGSPLGNAIVQMSDASYPVLSSLSDDSVTMLGNKITKVVVEKIPPSAIELGIDAFLGIPNEKVDKWTATLKQSYDGVTPDSCQSIPVPVQSLGRLAAGVKIDETKLKTLQSKYSSSNQAVPRSASSICLPSSKEGLEQLWVGQTELTMNLPKKETQEFARAAFKAILSVPNAELLRIVPDAKRAFTAGVDTKTSLKFEKAGKALDKAIQQDPRFQRLIPTS